MARGLNKCLLIGHVGKDPELKYTPGGAAVCNFTLATNEDYKDKEGKQVGKTEWHNIVVWNKQAEIAGQYLKKGSHVFIEGKLQTRSWEKDGQKHYMTEVVVLNFQMLGAKSDAAAADDRPDAWPSDAQVEAANPKTAAKARPEPAKEEELPF